MKEHPILFSTPMVQAILEGRKTQTRRTRGLKWVNESPDKFYFFGFENDPKIEIKLDIFKRYKGYYAVFENLTEEFNQLSKCPYGQPGDLLWVRENWASSKALDKVKPSNILSGFPCEYQAGGTSLMNYNELIDRGRWRPSIHMPKHAARIWLKVKDVRVERVQNISEEDAKAEGVKQYATKPDWMAAKFGFEILWGNINGQESWDANPWVWVVEFEVVSTTGKPETCNVEPETISK